MSIRYGTNEIGIYYQVFTSGFIYFCDKTGAYLCTHHHRTGKEGGHAVARRVQCVDRRAVADKYAPRLCTLCRCLLWFQKLAVCGDQTHRSTFRLCHQGLAVKGMYGLVEDPVLTAITDLANSGHPRRDVIRCPPSTSNSAPGTPTSAPDGGMRPGGRSSAFHGVEDKCLEICERMQGR
jgi:hypothetical protein